ncbi:unnamed protein product [Effrenium voratum]|uniref:ATP synthase subunit a, chloroplastic n=1 Tax=Effrenium voratum TaxID=2562239 RepID=A0AA36N2A1_9DINO|nr:unnamed protein product [Effrenium voratum]
MSGRSSALMRGAALLCLAWPLSFVAPNLTRATAPAPAARVAAAQPLRGASEASAPSAAIAPAAFSGATLLPAALFTARSMVSVLNVVRHAKAPVSEFGAPSGVRNFQEMALGFTSDIAKNNLGESFYRPWVPFISTIFLFIFVSNWSGALIPWKMFEIPAGELAAPTNNINTTVALSLLTSLAYFGGGLAKKGLGYFARYVKPTPILLPINILEDFTKPLSLSFRLFGNVVADELTVGVLCFLVPFVIPLPIMGLGLFAGSIQALIFSTLAAAYIHEALELRSRSALLSLAALAAGLAACRAFVAPRGAAAQAPPQHRGAIPTRQMQMSSTASEASEAAIPAFSGATLLPAALFTARSMVSVLNVVRHAKAPVSEFGAPSGVRNFQEMALGFTSDIAKNNLGESFYRPWVPFISTIFLFIFVSNWSGALIPWKMFEIPAGELAAPTNNINTTVALSLLTSLAYFGGGLAKKGLGYFARYVKPTPILLPINILEDFTKPLSLSFRLFGNVVADELTVGVLCFLVPFVIPLPIMGLGLFAGSIQALIFATLASAYIHEVRASKKPTAEDIQKLRTFFARAGLATRLLKSRLALPIAYPLNSAMLKEGGTTPAMAERDSVRQAELSGTDWKVTQKGLAHVTPIVAGMSKAEESREF